MKSVVAMVAIVRRVVAPVRERGLKCRRIICACLVAVSRSRKGAWIEILAAKSAPKLQTVAPVRERGLKSYRGE